MCCRATGATALARLGAPTADELGFAKALGVAEIGGTTVVVLEQDAAAGAVSTVVLRASTDQLLDDLERAIDDGVNTYKVPFKHTHGAPAAPSWRTVHDSPSAGIDQGEFPTA